MRIWATHYASDWSYPLTDHVRHHSRRPDITPALHAGAPRSPARRGSCRRRVGDAQRVAGARRAAMRVAVQMVKH